MGRLVSVRVDESAGGRWEDALVGYCETAIVGDEEVSTGLYRVLWGGFQVGGRGVDHEAHTPEGTPSDASACAARVSRARRNPPGISRSDSPSPVSALPPPDDAPIRPSPSPPSQWSPEDELFPVEEMLRAGAIRLLDTRVKGIRDPRAPPRRPIFETFESAKLRVSVATRGASPRRGMRPPARRRDRPRPPTRTSTRPSVPRRPIPLPRNPSPPPPPRLAFLSGWTIPAHSWRRRPPRRRRATRLNPPRRRTRPNPPNATPSIPARSPPISASGSPSSVVSKTRRARTSSTAKPLAPRRVDSSRGTSRAPTPPSTSSSRAATRFAAKPTLSWRPPRAVPVPDPRTPRGRRTPCESCSFSTPTRW